MDMGTAGELLSGTHVGGSGDDAGEAGAGGLAPNPVDSPGGGVIAPAASDPDQMRLRQIQLFNWGTFSDYLSIDVPEVGYLIVGPSGSGKSTLLDAHAALTTPPRWVDFNVAAREGDRRGKDRNLVTYLRGAWAQQTTDGGDYASRFLRPDTTWSAIAETWCDGKGRVVTLAQVLWIRGKSTSASDVKRLYLVLERNFDLRELRFFAERDFDVRRFKQDLPDAFVRDEFSAYQERFRRLLGIDSERALRLLHKTQAAKNLGDLNDFMRDFMLDPPDTFALADKLVAQFAELNEAHRAVVAARQQIETLKPARIDAADLDEARLRKTEVDELRAGLDAYAEQQRHRLLDEALVRQQTALEGQRQEARQLKQREDAEQTELRSLQTQRAEQGGGLLEDLQAQLQAAEDQRQARTAKRGVVTGASLALGWAPAETAADHVARRDEARAWLATATEQANQLNEKQYGLRRGLEQAEEAFKLSLTEVAALERQRSNIPARMLAVRERLAQALRIAEEQLPFAGELIEVRDEEADWQGAIERVLGGFAQSLLVDDRHYAQVAAWLNEHHTGERIVYYRTISQKAGLVSPGPDSLTRKLRFAQASQADWVREELKAHFDYQCAPTLSAFRQASRAVTREGQVKHGHVRHEKNDRHRVDDRSRWVLGFDSSAKLALYQKRAQDQALDIERFKRELEDSRRDSARHGERLTACTVLANTEWDEIDVGAAIAAVEGLQRRIVREKDSRPDLERLDQVITSQQAKCEAARQRYSRALGEVSRLEREGEGLANKRGKLRTELLDLSLTPHQRQGLEARYAGYRDELSLDSVDAATTRVTRALSDELNEIAGHIQNLGHRIERCFETFLRQWPAEGGGLDATLASAPDFFAKLDRLETDGLPRYEERFLTLLREQSEQNLTRLSTQLDHERKAIRDRMDLVNESLAGAPFGQGTHLVIETQDRLLPDVSAFRQQLRGALSHMLSADTEAIEQRFEVISTLVKRLGSADGPDKAWKQLVLDVRQHVEFIARELDRDGIEQEVYRSGAGKSGGQRQKLAATCLAAALRYQLGGQDRALPRFCTVFLDEAFDKADADFTKMAMNIFRTFGFQMIVATPLKSVMTLEPFIGGAAFVHIRDRNVSTVMEIAYDEASRRLKREGER